MSIVNLFSQIFEKAKDVKKSPLSETRKKEMINKTKIVVIGGVGQNVLEDLLHNALDNVDYWAVNSEKARLASVEKNPLVETVLIDRENIEQSLFEPIFEGAERLFLVASVAERTGSAITQVAEWAKSRGDISVYACVFPSFRIEGARRRVFSEQNLAKLEPFCDEIFVVDNEAMLQELPKSTPLVEGFKWLNQKIIDFIQQKMNV